LDIAEVITVAPTTTAGWRRGSNDYQRIAVWW